MDFHYILDITKVPSEDFLLYISDFHGLSPNIHKSTVKKIMEHHKDIDPCGAPDLLRIGRPAISILMTVQKYIPYHNANTLMLFSMRSVAPLCLYYHFRITLSRHELVYWLRGLHSYMFNMFFV